MADELIFTVSQLNKYVHDELEANPNLRMIYLVGEISNCVCHRSGHIYMTVKDEKSAIKAVIFHSAASRLNFTPKSGMQIKALGRVSLYERDGAFRFYIDYMLECGNGNLFAEFERLKKELSENGLFDDLAKKPIPQFPQKIGVITSPTGAVLQDIKNVLSRRYRLADIYLYGVHVQGDGAAAEMIDGIRYMNDNDTCDVIIIGRGGGSTEDLWEFNDKDLAYAIYDSKIPIISAVGHETDFTICDFVADLRAPTPSAAAELAAPDINDISDYLYNLNSRFNGIMNIKLSGYKERLDRIKANRAFASPTSVIDNRKDAVYRLKNQIFTAFNSNVKNKRMKLAEISAKINALSPLSTLERGYSVVKKDGKIIKSTAELNINDKISIRFANGGTVCHIDEIYNTENTDE